MPTLVSFRGWSFAAHGFDSWPVLGGRDISIDANYVTGGSVVPRFAGINLSTRMRHYQVAAQPGSDLETQRAALELGMRLDLSEESTLVELRSDGTQTAMQARLRNLSSTDNVTFDLIFEAADPYAKSSTPVTSIVVGPSTAGDAIPCALTLAGSTRTRPVITLTPQRAKATGGLYNQPYTVTEISGFDLVSVPYTVTINHAALVTAGKSTTSGADILVSVDGVDVARTVTGANTSTCRVTFPLTVKANQTASIMLRYAPLNQTYAGPGYAQSASVFTVTEQHGVSLVDYPYRLDINHASLVTSGYSKGDGSDIRVWVDGTELDRAISGANTTTCKVWGKLPLAANGTSVVCVTTASSGYDYSGGTFQPGNNAVDLGLSTNTNIVYSTPIISNNSDAAFALKPIFTKIGAVSDPTNYQAANFSGTDPGIKLSIMDIASPAQNGNYVRFYASGLRLASLSATYDYMNGVTSTIRSQAYVGQSSDLSTWSGAHTFVASFGSHTTGYRTDAFAAGTIAGIVGLERTTATQETGTANDNYIQMHGTGSSEVTLTLVSGDVPVNASLSNPTIAAGIETFGYQVNGALSDELGHKVAVQNLALSAAWTPTVNLLDYTEQMDNDSYTKVNTTVTRDNATAPDGTQTADTLFETTTNGQHRLTRQITKAASSLPYVYSVYAHPHGRDYLDFNVMDASRSNGVNVGFNVTTGALNFSPVAFGAGFTAGAATITLDQHGFYRCTLAVTSNTATTLLGEVLLRSNASTNSYAGDITKGIDLWGMQLEQSTTVSPYQPVYPLGGLVIDADQRTAYLTDRAGAAIANSALVARAALSLTGDDADWLALEPDQASTLTWTERGMDADGMRLDVNAASRWL